MNEINISFEVKYMKNENKIEEILNEDKMNEVAGKLGINTGERKHLHLKNGKMTCYKCGRQVGTTTDAYKKRIELVGNEEDLKYYTCKKCRSIINK